MFGLSVLGNKILVLGSHRVLTELLDKRGAVYADRPRYVGVGELMGLNRVRAHLVCHPSATLTDHGRV